MLYSREILVLAMVLALCLVTFVVLATGEAWAEEQPSQSTQQGTEQSKTTINGKVAEPVAEKTPPVKTPSVKTPPVQKPLPPTDETPPPAEEEPFPPPVDPAPSTPEPEPVPSTPEPREPEPQPAPQWFSVVITYGETVESEPALTTSWSTTDLEQAPNVAYPAAGSAAPVEDSGAYVTSDSADAWAPGYVVEDYAVPAADYYRASEPVLGPVASDQVAPESATLYPEPLRGLVPESVISLGTDPQSVPAASLLGTRGEAPVTIPKPSAVTPAPVLPASLGGAPRLPSSLVKTAARAVGTVQSAAASVANSTVQVLWSIVGGSTDNSSTEGTQGKPSEDTPQPAPAPLVPPVESSLFSLSMGGGNVGPGGSFAPLLVGILALSLIVLRRNFRTYLASCEVPKPSSAVLLPLERPG